MITQKRTQSLFFNELILKIKLQEEDESVDKLISEIFGEDNNNDTGDVQNNDFGTSLCICKCILFFLIYFFLE